MVTAGWARARARRFVVALVVALVLMAIGAGAAQAGQVETPAGQLQVWNVNTAGMDTGSITDYRQFVAYITNSFYAPYYPDVVTIQESGSPASRANCTQFESELEARTVPRQDYTCVQTSSQGGSAIVYRTRYLAAQAGGKSVPEREVDLSQNPATCPMSNTWKAITLRLRDAHAAKYVNVESVHLPNVGAPPDRDCAWENTKIVSPAVQPPTLAMADMYVMGGDWNHTDATATQSNTVWSAWECWYQGTNFQLGNCGSTVGNLGWRDAMFQQCYLGWGDHTPSGWYNCLHAYHWTHGSPPGRIDYLWAKQTSAITRQVTVPYPDARNAAGGTGPQQYSDHRGQGALLQY